MKKSITPMTFVPAMPVIIAAVKDGEKINFAPYSMYGQLSHEPPLLYISVTKEHLTAKMICKTKRFSINVPSIESLEKIKYCGSISGRKQDKSEEFDIFYGKNDDVPMISNCPVNLSCELHESIDLNNVFIFIGRVTETFSNEECLINNRPAATKVNPLICTNQGKFHRMGGELG